MAEKQEAKAGLPNSTAGAAPVDPSQRQGSRPSSAKQGLHWFGHGADDVLYNNESQLHSAGSSNCLAGEGVSEVSDGTSPPRDQGKESAFQREERLRLVKEKQNEERQRKLEELKQQALAAQKFREQKEEERRRRLEDMRLRDSDRRHQVEERKRQIWEAERDRREAILRKNQVREREARIESKKKNERSSIVFAFGSSTPRMLEPADTGGSYWATRRATSTSNVMMLSMSAAPGPLTRRSSERELDGSKKRATSAGGIDRSKAEGEEVDGENCIALPITATVRAARRKTDLMPTLPSPRDLTPGRGQTSRPIRSPGRAYSMSRLDQLAQPRKPRIPAPPPPPHEASLSRSMTHLAQQPLRKKDTSRSMSQLSSPPAPPPRQTRAERLRRKAREAAARSPSAEQQMSPPGFRSGEVTPSRPQSSLSQHSMSSGAAMSTSVHSALKMRPQTAPRRQRPYSIAVTGISSTPSSPDTNKPNVTPDHRNMKSPSVSGTDKPPIPKVHAAKKPLTPKPDLPKKPTDKLTKSAKSSASPTPKATPLQSPGVEVPTSELVSIEADETAAATTTTTVTSVTTVDTVEEGNVVETIVHNEVTVVSHTTDNDESVTETAVTKIEEEYTTVEPKEPTPPPPPPAVAEPIKDELVQHQQEPSGDLAEIEMTASMIAKTRITTEEEAKAALAERRRLAREQAEREAELERQRLEAERLAEEERIRQEEEEQRRMEEEQLRLLEEARKAEEERLRLAIEEAQKREEEEKRRKEEEAKMKQEKEEAERKAKEEAEKQRQEMEIRLKKEEEDRQARRKRVEAIMLRTRGKGTTPTSTPTKEDGEDSPNEEATTKQEPEKENIQEKFLNSERSHSDANLTAASVPKHNGHQNGVDNVVDQNNVTNNLLDLSLESDSKIHQSIQPPQPIVEQIIVTPTTTTPTNGKLSNEDNVNFNTPPPTSPFIAFQDNKKQDATVNDLLS